MELVTDSATTLIVGLFLYLLNQIFSYIAKRLDESDLEKETEQTLLEGMAKVQNEFVREAKAKAADGKLTKEEIIQFEQFALDHALSVANAPVKELLSKLTKERISSLIKQLL
jgi:hypothetical protein